MSKFTRAEVRKAVGEVCTDEIENALIALYLGATDPIKDELQKYKTEAEKLLAVHKELDDLKAAKQSGDAVKKDYDELKKKYDALEKSIEDGKNLESKKALYKALCKEAGLSDKGVEKALKYADFSKVEIEDGKIKNAEEHTKGVKSEWGDYVVKTEQHGAGTETPPRGDGSGEEKQLRMPDVIAKRRANLYGEVNKED